ncbi:MAG: hemagglutinin repeat-containing protein [Campylobacterales bacterium]
MGIIYFYFSTAKYLIEVDPQFADKGKWLSSDFMLSKLSYDPAYETKRFGDGYNEQKLITQQIGQLTGKRFLSGYNNDNAQFEALMNNALAQAGSLHLKIGASLSPAQVAALSSDIVWMVEKSVTVSGKTQSVLVPQVYLASNSVSLTPQGALISANNSAIVNAASTATNSGVIKSGNATYVLAKDVANRLGEIGSEGTLAVAGTNNITNTLGTLSSKGDMSLSAGRDININAANITSGSNIDMTAANDIKLSTVTTNKSYATIKETNNKTSTITAAKNLSATSGANITATGANISADTASLTAISGNIELKSAKDLQTSNYAASNHVYSSTDETIKGTTINTKGNLNIVAANVDNKSNAGNILISSSTLDSATGTTNLASAKDTTITGDKELHSEYDKRTSSSKGFFSSKTTTTTTNNVSNTQVGSNISGDNVKIASNQKIDIIASNIVATKDATLTALDNINITAGKNEHLNQSFSETKKSGLLTGGGGFGITIGTQTTSLSQTTQGYTQSDAKSTVGSIEGSVNIASNKEVAIKGSDIVAPKDLTISGSNVAITTGVDTLTQTDIQKVKQSGVTIALTGSVVAAVQTAQAMQQASKKAKSSRMTALAATSTALAAANAANDASKLTSSSFTQLAPDNNAKDAGAVGLSITYGESKSESKSVTNTTTNTASNLSSGGNTVITASSTDKDKGNIEVAGSNISSNKDVILTASNNVNLVSAQDTFDNSTNSNSSSWGAGVAVTFGSNGMAFGVTGNASAGKGKANETTLTNQNTHINANDTITIKSGTDTNIKGAVVAANTVKADVGNNLNIESKQDTSTYKSSSQSMGGSVTAGAGFSASASYAQSKAKSDYQSVNEQSGIKSKDGGFNIKVAGNTDLKGAVIESSDKAITDNKNSLTTATITTSDINNKAEYSASSMSVGISGGGSSMMGMGGYSDDKGDASSVTKSAISKSNINITNEDKQKALTGKDAKETVASINTDTKNSHTKLEKIFDKEEVEGKVQASAQIIQTFSSVAPKAIGDYSDSKKKELTAQAEQAQKENNTAKQQELLAEAKKWDEGGIYRVALHTAAGGMGGGLAGAAGAGVSAKTIPEIGKAIDEMNLPKEVKTALVAISGTVVGAAAGTVTGGGTSGAITGGNAGFTQTVNNYLNTVKMADGRRVIKDGKITKNNLDVYDENGKVIGKMLTPYTGFDEQGRPVVGAILDLNDKSGQNFLNNITNTNPGMLYFWYARNGGVNDFKMTGVDPALMQNLTVQGPEHAAYVQQLYRYQNRAMPINGTIFVSGSSSVPTIATARDIGNVGASYVSGYNGNSWITTRAYFDAYNAYKNLQFSEAGVSKAAEQIGWATGNKAYNQTIATQIGMDNKATIPQKPVK